jgi:hypothetical protein
MTTLNDILQPADIVAVRTGGWAGTAIRFGQALLGKPNLDNHIAIAHHLDTSGKFWWLLEGRPGGVGWADSRKYKTALMVNNCGQPGRSAGDRARVADAAKAMIGTKYDWQAIADDTLRSFRMPDLWADSWKEGVAPAQVVCSSYALYLYGIVNWDRPLVHARDCEPGDWTQWSLSKGFHVSVSG